MTFWGSGGHRLVTILAEMIRSALAWERENGLPRNAPDHDDREKGHRTRNGRPFTASSIENVLTNRCYEGKVVYHPDRPDEQVRDGEHHVPDEVKRLWLLCQHVKRERTRNKDGRPRSSRRAYPFSRVAVCDGCGSRYGQPVHQNSGAVVRRLYHGRPFCGLEPHSVRVENLMAQFHEGVLPYVELDGRWRSDIIKLLTAEDEQPNDAEQTKRLDRALGNLRKQHLWSDITDEEYRDQRHRIESQLRSLAPRQPVLHLPNLERGAQLLQDLPALWVHDGVSDQQREEFVGELFATASINGNTLVALEPKLQYGPLFAYLVADGVRKCRGEWGGEIQGAGAPKSAGPVARNPHPDRPYDSGSEGPARRTTIGAERHTANGTCPPPQTPRLRSQSLP